MITSLVYTTLVFALAASFFFTNSIAAGHAHGKSNSFSPGRSVCNSCSKRKQCRSKTCYRGRCANGPQEFRACTRNGRRECADCEVNEDCLNSNCRQKLCAINDWVLQKCHRLVQLEEELKKGTVTSHRISFDEGSLDSSDIFSEHSVRFGVRISLADVETAEIEDLQA